VSHLGELVICKDKNRQCSAGRIHRPDVLVLLRCVRAEGKEIRMEVEG
jgi:hypothetical protein